MIKPRGRESAPDAWTILLKEEAAGQLNHTTLVGYLHDVSTNYEKLEQTDQLEWE